jgi:iron-sulfur cluster assembly protein|tara:strand:- start:2518 stop:2859 length:342 start_codon:yes stop_codon:yes gene_type:complete
METFKPAELNFSDEAIKHFNKSIINKKNSIGVRIGVRKAGCSGYEYFFDFVDEINLEDSIFEENGCKIFVDNQSLSFLKGTLVDYSEDGLNKGIKFKNPNAKAVCGCGESFTI